MQLPHDILPDYKVEVNYSKFKSFFKVLFIKLFFQDNDHNYDTGFDYMVEAGEKGEKNCLYFVARAYDSGIGLSKHK